MGLSFLGQAHGLYLDVDETDFYLRRARIILAGQIADGIKFFAETDNDNAGRRGTPDSSTDIQDAFIDLRILDSDHWVEVGLILLPFSFENKSSAASLLGIDYNAEVVKLANTFVWRDCGAELHGHFLNRRVAYRAGVFDGYDSDGGNKNPDADMRLTGHMAVNLLGKAETGWFVNQTRLNREGSYLSIGVGGDMQQKATLPDDADPVDSEAWVVDFQSGCSAGDVDFTLNGAWYEWDNAGFEGNTAFVEGGAMLGKTMLTGKYSLQDPDEDGDTENYTVGLHLFATGQNTRGGIECRFGDSADEILLGLQFLL